MSKSVYITVDKTTASGLLKLLDEVESWETLDEHRSLSDEEVYALRALLKDLQSRALTHRK